MCTEHAQMPCILQQCFLAPLWWAIIAMTWRPLSSSSVSKARFVTAGAIFFEGVNTRPPSVLHFYIKTPLHTLKYHQKSCMKQCGWNTFHINFLWKTQCNYFWRRKYLLILPAHSVRQSSVIVSIVLQVHISANSYRKSLAIVIVSFCTCSIRILLFE
jgi:hypothetical protein